MGGCEQAGVLGAGERGREGGGGGMKKREMKGKREGRRREKISSWLAVIWQLLQATRPQISLADCSHDAIWVGGRGHGILRRVDTMTKRQ